MFWNSVSVPSSWVGKNDAVMIGSSDIYTGKRGKPRNFIYILTISTGKKA
jgi:hypothetical protein